jgi:hypothetical protein
MKSTFESALKSGHGNALLYAGAIGLIASDIIPTPADAIYFRTMAKNKQKLNSKEITHLNNIGKEKLYYIIA